MPQSENKYRSFSDVLKTRAQMHGDRAAITFASSRDDRDQQLTYRALHDCASRLAIRLLESAEPGARALIVCQPGLDYVVAMIGCMYAGVVPVPVYPPTRHRPLERLTGIVRDAEATLALTTRTVLEGFRDRLDAADMTGLNWVCVDSTRADLNSVGVETAVATPGNPDALAFLQYTSGSTGRPKGVEVTHRCLLDNLAAIAEKFKTTESDKLFIWLPPYHDMGLIGGILHPLFAGASSVLMSPNAFLERPLRWLEELTQRKTTFTGAPNFAYQLCVDRISDQQVGNLDLSQLRCAFVGAEPVRDQTLSAFVEKFAVCGFDANAFLPCYGLAEATLFVAGVDSGKQWSSRRLSADRPHQRLVSHGMSAHVQPVIVSPATETEVPDGTEGEIWVPAAGAARGYWRRPEQTEHTFRARLADTLEGPFLRTGDLGFIDGGQIYITGRIKDLIVVNGRNVYPQDIEQSVEQAHADIQTGASAAFSIAGHEAEAVVVVCEIRRQAHRRFDAQTIESAIRRAVSRDHQVSVSQILLLSPARLPRTTSGKVQRRACRQAVIDRTLAHLNESAKVGCAAAPPKVALRQSVALEQIAEVVATALKVGVEQVSLDKPINDLGLDSLDAVNLKFEIEQRFDLVIPVDAFFDDTSLQQLVSGEGVSASVEADSPAGEPLVSEVEPDLRISLMYFSSDANQSARDGYDLVIQGSERADQLGFHAVWLPERHFHPFGGLYPSPAVLASAIAMRTRNLRVRAGSVVLPMSDPIRVAEEWSVIDNLSNGRVDLAVAAGWNPNDFVLAPSQYASRVPCLFDSLNALKLLWQGGSVQRTNGVGKQAEVQIYPRPIQPELNCWITCSGGPERFAQAGEAGANVLTALLFQDIDELAEKIEAYRQARARSGFDPNSGQVTLMMHTFMGTEANQVKQTVKGPFMKYLESSVDLWRQGEARLDELTEAEKSQVLEFAFERYYRSSALFGTSAQCSERVAQLRAVGVNEIACLVDFGIANDAVIASLSEIAQLIPGDVPAKNKAVPLPEPAIENPQSVSRAPALDPSVTFVRQAQRASNERARRVLLTGTTGFLGAHVLADYLNNGATQVSCLVRASDPGQALNRVKTTLTRYGLWHGGLQDRIQPIPGDLAQPWLGLAPEKFEHLALGIDTIVHTACEVNLLAGYDQLAPANVTGTETLLRLAASGHATSFHYVSTCGVFSEGYDETETVDERHPPRAPVHWTVPLAQTKWEAEQLVWQASERGLAVKVYRPGTLTASTETSVSPPSSYVAALMQTCIELGAVPDIADRLQMCPVNFVSDAIIKLSGQAVPSNSAYHLINPNSLPVNELPRLLGSFGYDLTLESASQWRDHLSGAMAEQRCQQFRPFAGFLSAGDGASDQLFRTRAPRVLSRSELALARLSVQCPSLSRSVSAMLGLTDSTPALRLTQPAMQSVALQ